LSNKLIQLIPYMSNEHRTAWDNCLRIIRDNVPAGSFKTWFEPIVPVKLEERILTIQVPSAFFYEYLEEQFIDILRKTLRMVLGNGAKLEYNVVMGTNHNDIPYTPSNIPPITILKFRTNRLQYR
jgi:chromosomal replication initiator protein